MDRLAKALAGDWDTIETMVRSQLFPSGDLGRGMVHARVAAGGYALIYEVYSARSGWKAGWLTGDLVGQSLLALLLSGLLQQPVWPLQDAGNGAVEARFVGERLRQGGQWDEDILAGQLYFCSDFSMDGESAIGIEGCQSRSFVASVQ
jgi:hypothetical protein